MISVSTRLMEYDQATKTLTSTSRKLGMWPDFFPHEIQVLGKSGEKVFDWVIEETKLVDPQKPWGAWYTVAAVYFERDGDGLKLRVTVG